MKTLPALTEDAVIDLAREGGVAYMPRLAAPRRIALSELDEQQRDRVCSILRRSLPLGQDAEKSDSPGRGDQRYFRIQISWTQQNSTHHTDVVVLIAESDAPSELEELWRRGKDCVCD